LACAFILAPGPARAQTEVIPKGFYQSSVDDAPENPSEAWLIAYGGRLYDLWWGVLLNDPPESTHPAYPKSAPLRGAETWRCVSCHGWDYRGDAGELGRRAERTGIKGIDGMAGMPPAKIEAVIRNDLHGFTKQMLPDNAVRALALFVSKGTNDAGGRIDPQTKHVSGNMDHGRAVFQNVCAMCHDFDGGAWIGESEEQLSLARVIHKNPWRAFHKVMNGQTFADMPAMRVFGADTLLDVLSYAQTLPTRVDGN
jgi:thiosulfate dehydrogenase